MTEPTMFTAEMAGDRSTPAQMLADIAALRPDLRPIVAGNPSAYPGLLEWLGSLGEPAVDAALAARRAAEESVQAQPPQPQPQPWQGQQGQPQPWQGQAGQPQPWQGQPGQPGQPLGYQPAPAGSGTSGKKVLVIVAIVVGVLLVLGIGAILVLRSVIGNAVNSIDITDGTGFSTGETYGDDPALDGLWDACEAEDWSSCVELYWQSPSGTDYEQFGASCGGRADESTGGCAALNGEEPTVDGANAYGDDPVLDAIWDSCAEGDMAACDKLWDDSPIGSEYETFGDTCGGTVPADSGLYCSEQ